MEPSPAELARKTWRTLEPLHGFIYFAPEAAQNYSALGLEGMTGYFASRAASMGAVPAEVVCATFYNFNPALVHAAIPSAWDAASPEAISAARLDAVDHGLRRLIPDAIDSADMASAAELARIAADATTDLTAGRPLFSSYLHQRWPEQPHLALWHAQTLLREFRGDGHISLLTAHGLSGIEALVLHAAVGPVSREVLQTSRGWSDEEWQEAIDGLMARGLVNAEGGTTPQGQQLRDEIEDRTDELARAPYETLGAQGCHQLRGLVRPWSQTIAKAIF